MLGAKQVLNESSRCRSEPPFGVAALGQQFSPSTGRTSTEPPNS
jgi:hypothetical protein